MTVCVVLSFLANGAGFLVAGVIYSTAVLVVASRISEADRYQFVHVVTLFLLLYSILLVASHYALISNPFETFYAGDDEVQYFTKAENLAALPYCGIWHAAFTNLYYIGAPLFYAWIGTLTKLLGGTAFYADLFLKLNTAFFGSFIPGVIYLLSRHIADARKSRNAAIVYGLFSFTLIYSVVLLRDVQIALIYAIGFYIIFSRTYSLKNYVIMAVLAVVAYFIRMENGLFFAALIVAWMLSARSRNKHLMLLGAVVICAGGIFYVGGFQFVFNSLTETLQFYTARTLSYSPGSSLRTQLYALPVPLNYLVLGVYSQIVPFPFWAPFEDIVTTTKRIFFVPYAVAGLFWFAVWMRLIMNYRKTARFVKRYKLVVGITVVYIFLVAAGEINARRLMAVYPIIFMCYIFISSPRLKAREYLYSGSIYCLLLLAYGILKT